MHLPQSDTELVGRSQEMNQLHKLLKRTIQAQGQVVLLIGEAGIGKTRLLASLTSLAKNYNFEVVRGECSEPDQDFPYAPIIDGLRTRFSGITAEELQHIIGPFQSELLRLLPELALQFDIPTHPGWLDPEAEKRRLFEVLVQVYQRIARSGLLLIFEDIHWCDDSSLEFVRILTRRVSKLPIMVALSSRVVTPESEVAKLQSYLDRSENAQTTTLQPLTEAETESLLKTVLQTTEAIHPTLLQRLYSLTQGNPLYAQQIVYMLQQNRQINLVNGAWIVTDASSEVEIPQSIRQTIQQQLAVLTDEETRLLQVAGVAGREFSLTLLQGLLHFDDALLLKLIKKLTKLHFFHEISRDRFAFHHAVIRQVIYDSLLIRERQHIHQAILHYLQDTQAPVTLVDLSHHAYNAEDWEAAFDYGLQAGKHALALHSSQAAVEQFTHAIQAASRLGKRDIAKLSMLRGDAFSNLSRFQAAHADYETALQIAEAADDRMSAWQAVIALAKLWAAQDYRRVKDYCERALALARAMDDAATIAHSLNRLGNWHLNTGQVELALQHYEDALTVFDGSNGLAGKAETFSLIGMAANASFYFSKSVDYYRRAIELYRQLDNRQALAWTLANLGLITADTEMIRASIEIAREIGFYSAEAYGCICAGNVYSNRGDYSPALAYVERAVDLAQAINHTEWLAAAHLRLGLIYRDLFDLDKATEHAATGTALAKQSGSHWFIARAIGLNVSILVANNQLAEAEALLTEYQAPAKPILQQFEITLARAELARARAQPEKIIEIAEAMAHVTHDTEEDLPVVPYFTFYRPLIAEAYLRLEEREQALITLESARRDCERFHLLSLLWQIDIMLGKIHAQDHETTSHEYYQSAQATIGQIAQTVPAELRANFLHRALAKMPTSKRNAVDQMAAHDLTRRETEIVHEIALGKNNQQIADDLHITIKTVEAHITRILSKLSMTSRTQIALWAVEKDL
jgi:DNA-binding CsgD family transcriptional regulator/energy-coupling factor transporter ATP-binding protein EcfA2